jgi:hypothetical protein
VSGKNQENLVSLLITGIFHRIWRSTKKDIFFSSYRDVQQNETPPSVSAFDYYRWVWNDAWYLQKYTGVSERKYKYPNDSRLYNLKNVVHRLLDNPGLVGGLRIGLADTIKMKGITLTTVIIIIGRQILQYSTNFLDK